MSRKESHYVHFSRSLQTRYRNLRVLPLCTKCGKGFEDGEIIFSKKTQRSASMNIRKMYHEKCWTDGGGEPYMPMIRDDRLKRMKEKIAEKKLKRSA